MADRGNESGALNQPSYLRLHPSTVSLQRVLQGRGKEDGRGRMEEERLGGHWRWGGGSAAALLLLGFDPDLGTSICLR